MLRYVYTISMHDSERLLKKSTLLGVMQTITHKILFRSGGDGKVQF